MLHRGLLSTSEFARLSGIPRSKLIFYDQIGLFSPAERGDNTYRYYALNQLIAAGFINDMTSFGVPLKELIKLQKKRNPHLMHEVLQQEIEDYKKRVAELRESVSVMTVMTTLMEHGMTAEGIDIEVKEYEPHGLILGEENPYQDASSFFPGYLSFINNAKRSGLNVRYPVGGYFDSIDRFLENPGIPTNYYFVHPRGKTERPGGKFLAGYTRGFYGVTNDLPERMMSYAKKHKLELTGPVFNTYLLDETSMSDPDEFLLRVSIQIVDKGDNTQHKPQLRKMDTAAAKPDTKQKASAAAKPAAQTKGAAAKAKAPAIKGAAAKAKTTVAKPAAVKPASKPKAAVKPKPASQAKPKAAAAKPLSKKK